MTSPELLYQDDQRSLYALLGNHQKLDGGSMFGNAPKAVWERWIEPDEQNRIPLACRCLLIKESSGRILLCETGIGAFFEPKLKDRFGVQEQEHVLLQQLQALDLSPEQIDVIILSHLHFDHAGGLLKAWQEGHKSSLAFPKAKLVLGREAWNRALNPHPRDRASFIPELTELLKERLQAGALELVEQSEDRTYQSQILGDEYQFYVSHGHTPGQLHLEVPCARGPLLFCGDLIPGVAWVHLPITMGYDRYPELLIDEKEALLSRLLERNGWLFFTHDPIYACAELERDHQGRYRARL